MSDRAKTTFDTPRLVPGYEPRAVGPRVSRIRIAGWVAVAVLSYALVAFAIGRITEPADPFAAIRFTKTTFTQLRKQANEINAVFVGTNRMYRDIDPRVVDDTVTSLGESIRSFNLSMPGMSLLEQISVLRRIAAQQPKKLRFVMLEPAFSTGFQINNLWTERVTFLHDRLLLPLIIKYNSCTPNLGNRVLTIAHHLIAFYHNAFAIGRLGQFVFLAIRHDAGEEPVSSDTRGYVLLGGLWHGAAWTLVIWGALHGLALVIHREWKERTANLWERRIQAMAPFFWLLTLGWVCLAWVFFRAQGLHSAIEMLGHIFAWTPGVSGIPSQVVSIVAGLGFAQWLVSRAPEFDFAVMPRWTFAVAYGCLAAVVTSLMATQYRPFIYFQF